MKPALSQSASAKLQGSAERVKHHLFLECGWLRSGSFLCTLKPKCLFYWIRRLICEGCEECRSALIYSLVFDGSAAGKQNARDQSSASSIDSAPHSPLGPGPLLPGDCTVHVHKGTSRHRLDRPRFSICIQFKRWSNQINLFPRKSYPVLYIYSNLINYFTNMFFFVLSFKYWLFSGVI